MYQAIQQTGISTYYWEQGAMQRNGVSYAMFMSSAEKISSSIMVCWSESGCCSVAGCGCATDLFWSKGSEYRF